MLLNPSSQLSPEMGAWLDAHEQELVAELIRLRAEVASLTRKAYCRQCGNELFTDRKFCDVTCMRLYQTASVPVRQNNRCVNCGKTLARSQIKLGYYNCSRLCSFAWRKQQALKKK